MVHLKDKNDDQKRVTAFNELAALISNAKTKVKGAQNITLTPTLVEGNSGEQEVFIYTSAKEAKLANKVLNLGLPGYRERHVISRLGWFSKPRWLFNLQRKLQPNTPVSGVIDIRIPSLLMRNSSTLREWMDRRNGINHVLDYTSKKVPGYTLRVNIRDQGLQLLGG
jgi:hypothetical protein